MEARDTLRLEMGYALYGHELDGDHTPVGVTEGAFISCRKDFIGRAAVEAELENGLKRKLLALQLDTRRAARAGDTVVAEGKPVGTVTSGSLSPSLGVAIALAQVDVEAAEGELGIEVRGNTLACSRVDLPFLQGGQCPGLSETVLEFVRLCPCTCL